MHLERYWMQNVREYEAISYHWGEKSAVRPTVYIDGQKKKIGRNLETMLKTLRRPDQERVLWADEICIHQDDPHEVSQQVRHMHVIYPLAKRVLCYIGPDDDTVGTAFRIFREWAPAYGDGKANDKLKAELVQRTQKQVAQGGKEPKALKQLFERPWWRRAWTLQEVCVSQSRPPLIICGDHELDWKTFYFGCLAMFGSLREQDRVAALGRAVGYVLPMLRLCWADKSNNKLSHLIPIVASREAKKQQHLIFSLLGLTAGEGIHYPRADDRLTEAQVSILYTRAIIRAERNLDILISVGESKQDEGVPSWAIKLHDLHGDRSLLDADQPQGDGTIYRFNATRGTRPVLGRSDGDFDRVLLLDGVTIDTISETYKPDEVLGKFTQDSQNVWFQVQEGAAAFARNLANPQRYGAPDQGTCEAALRVLTADRTYFASRAHANADWSMWEGLWVAYKRFVQEKGRKAGPRIAQKEELMQYVRENFGLRRPRTRPGKPSPLDAWLDQILVADFLSNVSIKTAGRCVFATRQGYLGLGPTCCRQGDRVCLLYGATVPFVLRPGSSSSRPTFRLLDEAYVEGLMYGEGIVGNRETRTFALI